MKVDIKKQKGKSQTHCLKQVKQTNTKENQNLDLKMQKIQKQLASLNLEIQSLLEEKKFKDNTQKALVRQRKKLQNCFLLKDLSIKESNQIERQKIQNQPKHSQLFQSKVKNNFRDVNQTITRYIKQLQVLKNRQSLTLSQNSQEKTQSQSHQPNRKLQCQSLHLKQIFNPEQTLNHQSKTSKLQQKLTLLYEKIQLNLQREQPYLHQKILQRIKRQAQSYTRKNLLQQIYQQIKQNSKWITQETNRVNNQLQEQKVQQICVNNLGLMKKIMAKKVANNDWIFQNYSEANFLNSSTLGFPIIKITQQYQEVLKKLQQRRIADQLDMVRQGNNCKKSANSEKSLNQLLSDKAIQNFMNQKGNQQDQLEQSEKELGDRVEKLHERIQNLTKL